ncbi:MAG: CDP-glycerol glycerophosphotransferase family protein [Bacilli bacterium]|nr:CDP-glycerol glycerophosphotransferase family protein [Bacilli bacterium]
MNVKKIKNIFKKYIYKSNYIKYYKKLKIRPDCIVLESRHGDTLDGNIYYILKELSTNKLYRSFKIYLFVNIKSSKKIKKFLKLKNIKNIKIVKRNFMKYYKLLASTKYLINDTCFDDFFIKKEGQIYLNTWHGTPIKSLGRPSNRDFYRLGNVQKNFFVADYLLYPSEFMMKMMLKNYMLENICDSKILLMDYPRNIAFVDKKSKEKIRKELNIEDKYIIAYMPTFRNERNSKVELEDTINILKQLDTKLKNNQIMYVNLHPFIKGAINFDELKHIKKFPAKYETYEFLNITDCLITDYSSVVFDYAITGNKIVLYTYDEKEYLEKRGCEFSLDKLPFPKVDTITKLVKEINNKKIINYNEFTSKFCKYSNKNSVKNICELVLLNKNNDIKVKTIDKNNKKNILIYGGDLANNKITTDLFDYIKNIDRTKYNIYLTYIKINKNNEVLRQLPEDVNYISIEGSINTTLLEKILFKIYYKRECPNLIKNIIFKSMKYEIKRLYGNIKFDKVIQFSGYDFDIITLFSLFDCERIIYVHKRMVNKYINNKKNHILNYAYNNYDKIYVFKETDKEYLDRYIDNKKVFLIENFDLNELS